MKKFLLVCLAVVAVMLPETGQAEEGKITTVPITPFVKGEAVEIAGLPTKYLPGLKVTVSKPKMSETNFEISHVYKNKEFVIGSEYVGLDMIAPVNPLEFEMIVIESGQLLNINKKVHIVAQEFPVFFKREGNKLTLVEGAASLLLTGGE